MPQQGPEQARSWVLAALDEFERPLVRYASRLLGDEDSARDVVQHVFLRLCDQSPEEVGGRVGPWLFAVCRNRAVDVMRARGAAVSLDGDAPEPLGREPDPAEAAEQEELYRRLGGLVAELPPARREVLDLWSAGFSCREIAQIAGYSEANVRVLIHRAVKQLRERMDPMECGDSSPLSSRLEKRRLVRRTPRRYR